MKCHVVSTLVCLVSALSFAAKPSAPAAHLIESVPWHQQINGLFCGDGSLEIVFDHWGPDISQRAIANVARTSSMGTWSDDIRRAGHFSHLSAAQGRFYPNEGPVAGFAERGLGYAAFSHAAAAPWLEELKGLIADNIPVVMLMQFARDGTGGGHYRVAVGYDDVQGVIYFSDPWGRDMRYLPGTEGLVAWTYQEVITSWNYAEYGTPLPFFGVAIFPWSVDLRVSGWVEPGSTVTVRAVVSYPCPAPFDEDQYPASDAVAELSVPPGMTVLGASSAALGSLPAGSSRTVSWRVRVDGNVSGESLAVTARGRITGSAPEAAWAGGTVVYPPYVYTDEIGGVGLIRW